MHPKFLLPLLICLVFNAVLPAAAQSAKKAAPAGGAKSSAWTGTVSYTRTQSLSESKTEDRISGRGKDTRNFSLKYDYKATVGVVEDPQRRGSSIGKANITHSFAATDTTLAVEKNSCDRGKTWQEMTGKFVSESTVSGTGKEQANVHIGINTDGTYSVSVALPPIQGMASSTQTATYSGQCTPKEGKNLTGGPTPTTIDGNSLTSDGSHRLNPEEPNRLSGSYSSSFAGVTETISWSLQKDGGPLRITDLKFEDMKYPTWDNWQEISEQTGTVDGNWVKIRAIVFNDSGDTRTAEVYIKETYKGDKWDGARQDQPLKDQTFTVTLDPGEAREVEMLWDCSGYAWYDDGRPRYVQRIKAEVWENARKADEMTKNLKVKPRPIVLVGGIWTGPNDFEIFQNIFTTAHSYDWKACAVVDASSHGTIGGEGQIKEVPLKSSVYQQADNLTTYVNGIRQSLNAWHVDMLGHSSGGLVARLYVHKQMEVLPDAYPVVKHLMMLGTPNNGISCAESMVHDDAPAEHQAMAKQLTPEEMTLFNRYVTQRKGTKFSALAGNSQPILCMTPQWNDGYVAVDSAKHGVEDVTLTSASHRDMLSTQTFTDYIKPHVVTGPRGTYPFAATPKN